MTDGDQDGRRAGIAGAASRNGGRLEGPEELVLAALGFERRGSSLRRPRVVPLEPELRLHPPLSPGGAALGLRQGQLAQRPEHVPDATPAVHPRSTNPTATRPTAASKRSGLARERRTGRAWRATSSVRESRHKLAPAQSSTGEPRGQALSRSTAVLDFTDLCGEPARLVGEIQP